MKPITKIIRQFDKETSLYRFTYDEKKYSLIWQRLDDKTGEMFMRLNDYSIVEKDNRIKAFCKQCKVMILEDCLLDENEVALYLRDKYNL